MTYANKIKIVLLKHTTETNSKINIREFYLVREVLTRINQWGEGQKWELSQKRRKNGKENWWVKMMAISGHQRNLIKTQWDNTTNP